MEEQKYKELEKQYVERNLSTKKILEHYHKPVLFFAKELRRLNRESKKRGSKKTPNKAQMKGIISKVNNFYNMARRAEYQVKKELESL